MYYKVSVNGQELPVHEARVSAYPLNQVWQGNQRPVEQTELAWFVTFDFSDKANLEIEVHNTEIESIEIRPLESGIDWNHNGNKIDVKLTSPRQFTVEVNGKHYALHVFANAPLNYEHTENEIYFGPGEHEAGLIMPKAGQTVCIDEGAVVYGAIFAYKAENVRITGRGILDCSRLLRGEEDSKGIPEYEMAEQFEKLDFPVRDKKYCSPVVAYGCENLTIEGITIRDSMLWTMLIRNGCKNVTIDNIKIVGQWRYNSDGINLCNSENVHLKNSFVRSFDDCVVIRGAYLEQETGITRNITVENCVLWCDWGKSLEVWAGHKPCNIQDITFRNNYLIRLSNLAMDITTWFGSNDTHINGITFENIFIDTDEKYDAPQIQSETHKTYEPNSGYIPSLLRIDCDKLGDFIGGQTPGTLEDKSNYSTKYENIVVKNIRCRGKGELLDMKIDAVRNPVEISNVKLNGIDYNSISIIGKVNNLSLENE